MTDRAPPSPARVTSRSGADAARAAHEALATVDVDPAAALGLARAAGQYARSVGARTALSVALRAQGVALMQLGDPGAAISPLRRAVTVGAGDGAADQARVSLAAAYGLRGRAGAALRELNQALAGLSGVEAARARTQRAALFQLHGRADAALADLRDALPVLRRHDDAVWQTRALSNRGLLHAERREFSSAQADLRAARAVADAHGLTLASAIAEQNLGCVLAGVGQLTAALACFDSAGSRYHRLGIEDGSLWRDRTEVLLTLRLVNEAVAAARQAVRIDSTRRVTATLPDSRLRLSTALLVSGDAPGAFLEAQRAAQEFTRLDRRDGVALARWARLQARAVRDAATGPAQARGCARELAAAGWTVPALEARVLAGRLSLERGQLTQARSDLRLAARARTSGPADVRTRAWLAEGLLRAADGRPRAALRAWSAGLRVVEDYQQSLGATELRAHVTLHRGAIARTALGAVVAAGDARAALGWSERARATALLRRAPTPPADPGTAQELADLRATVQEVAAAREQGRPDTALVARQVRLENSVAARNRARQADPAGPQPQRGRPGQDVGTIVACVSEADAALVEYVGLADELYAVTVAGGCVRLHHLGSLAPVAGQREHLCFALDRMADPVQAADPSAVDRIGAAELVVSVTARRLAELLLAPLRRVIGERALVLVPTGPLRLLPWSVLPGCEQRPVTVAPSAALWCRAMRRPPATSGPVVVTDGPGLPGATAEATSVAALHPGSVRLTGAGATVAHVTHALDGARLAHLAAHGHLREDNPLFSSLTLHDGPLQVHDLERLDRAPEHLVLTACDTGRTAAVGDEWLGLTAALVQAGCRSLIAPVRPVPDAGTGAFALAYHRRLLAGDPPALALAAVTAAASGAGPAAGAVARSFVCLGEGLLGPV